jgi:hypothetical protein
MGIGMAMRLMTWTLAGIFVIAVIMGIRSIPLKVLWLAAAGSLWYFVGPWGALPLMILVILGIATLQLQSLEMKARSERPTSSSV